MIWQSTIQDLLVQQDHDRALEDERSASINETKCEHDLVSSCSRDKTHVKGLVGETQEYLCVKVANQSLLFEDGVVLTQNGDGRTSL